VAFFAAKAARAATNLDISGFLHEFCAFCLARFGREEGAILDMEPFIYINDIK
jgi:hypothetical protein